jgi:benzoyl-CoA reductase/2-hydroxyglutaryl-CoA dehydratase subunit BcrC/BadD/HgdB
MSHMRKELLGLIEETALRFLAVTLIASLAGLGIGWLFLAFITKSEQLRDRTSEKNREMRRASTVLPGLKPSSREEAESNARSQTTLAMASLAKQPARPVGITYYERILTRQEGRIDEIKAFKRGGGKVVGSFCLFTPIELILASGAIPIRLDSGLYCTIAPSEQILPSDTCPVIKSILGTKMLRLSPYIELCDVLVCPISCEMKTKLGEFVNDTMPVWRIEVPKHRDDLRADGFWLDELKEFEGNLEILTGRKITRDALHRSIQLTQNARTVFHMLSELRQCRPPPISGRDAMLVTQAAWYDDLERWTEKTRELCNELEQRVGNRGTEADSDAPRILLAGSPVIWPNWKLPSLIEESGAVIVCDELCSGDQGALSDPVNVDEWTKQGMLAALADRYLLPVTCPCFTPNKGRLDRILRLMSDFKVDGVIYHQLRGCYIQKIEFGPIRAGLKDLKMPVLGIETDYSHEDLGQLKTRVEAFLEMLQSAKLTA